MNLSKGRVIFRRIGGRIVPIFQAHPIATGFATVTAATLGAQKIRQKSAEALKGKGKKSFGMLPNAVLDVGISAGLIHGAMRLHPSVGHAVGETMGVFKRAFFYKR